MWSKLNESGKTAFFLFCISIASVFLVIKNGPQYRVGDTNLVSCSRGNKLFFQGKGIDMFKRLNYNTYQVHAANFRFVSCKEKNCNVLKVGNDKTFTLSGECKYYDEPRINT